jgi:hypothetical protein
MTHLPAKTGWLWIKEGFSYFKKQPVGFNLIFLAYFLVMNIISSIPLMIFNTVPVFKLLSIITLPLFSMAFMLACRQIQAKQRIQIKAIFAFLRAPSSKPLIFLGCLYPIAGIIALAVSILADGGLLWQVSVGNEINAADIPNSNILSAVFVSFLVCIPMVMALWYAPPLIAWKNMSLVQALFYSFFTVYRHWKAFFVYFAGWFVISIVLPSLFSAIIAMLFGFQMAIAIALPVSIILTVVIYCSFYPTYTAVFDETPQQPGGEE